MWAFITLGIHINTRQPQGPLWIANVFVMRTTGNVFWRGRWGKPGLSQSLPQLPFTKSSIQYVFHFQHHSQTEWTVFCFQQHWSASELPGLGILEGKWSARPGEMAHRWEDLIDFPWAKIYFEVSVDILDHNAAERTAGMCVCINAEEQE